MDIKVLKELYATERGQIWAGQVRDALKLHAHGPVLLWGYGVPYGVENVTMNFQDLKGETRLPYGKGAFAQVVLVHVLEFAPRPEEVLKEAYRVLQGQGEVTVVVPQKLQQETPFFIGKPFEVGEVKALLTGQFQDVQVQGCGRKGMGWWPQMCPLLVATGQKQVLGGTKVPARTEILPNLVPGKPVGACSIRS